MRPWQRSNQRQVGRPSSSRRVGTIGTYGHYIASQNVHRGIVCGCSLQDKQQSMQHSNSTPLWQGHTSTSHGILDFHGLQWAAISGQVAQSLAEVDDKAPCALKMDVNEVGCETHQQADILGCPTCVNHGVVVQIVPDALREVG